jgi:hypothetical protein
MPEIRPVVKANWRALIKLEVGEMIGDEVLGVEIALNRPKFL